MKKGLFLLMICVIASMLVMAGCSEKSATGGEQGQSTGGGPSEKSTVFNPAVSRDTSDALVVAAQEGFTGNFVPHYSVSASEVYLSQLTFNKLINIDSEGIIHPELAEIKEISEDKRSITLALRDDVLFSDGTPLTTKDVAFSYNLLADPSYDGPMGYLVMDIEGYDEYISDTEGDVKTMSGIEIINDHEIKITFLDAMRPNLDVLGTVQILPEHFYGFEKGNSAALQEKSGEVVGSGPYVMTHYEPAQYVELKANDSYFGEKKPQIKKIIAKVTQGATVLDELIAGEIDLIDRISNPDDLETLQDAGFIDLLPFMSPGYTYFEFNCMEEPTNDKNVRQALAYGLDCQAFVDGYYRDMATTQSNVLPAASWAYSENVTDYSYNPEKAKELLEASGWAANGDGFRYKDGEKLSIELSLASDNPAMEFMIPIMIDNYEKIGVELLINYLDFNSLSALVFDEKEGYSMYSMGVDYGSPDPDQLFADFHTDFDVPGGYNASRYRNPEADALLVEAKMIFNKEEANVLYEEWAMVVTDDMPRLVLATAKPKVAINSRVKGHSPSTFVAWSKDILNMYIEE